jgi:Kef-type K+ transport system membrane component KefB
LPFVLGYGVCLLLAEGQLVAIAAGATLTATSVGITARVLSDLNRLKERESQIILGAAVVDDVIGLIILAVVGAMMQGEKLAPLEVLLTVAIALAFLTGTLLLGRLIVPLLLSFANRGQLPGIPTLSGLLLAFGFAWLASVFMGGAAMIVGAFAAGLLVRGSSLAHDIELGVAHVGHFFVPLFFLVVGAAVDVRVLNPVNPANRSTLLVAGLLIVAAVIGKFVAGYAPFWIDANKKVIGVGMVPRGEVGLIFAQRGLATGVFTSSLFSALTLTVMVTTFLAPPLLRLLFPPGRVPRKSVPPEGGVQELVTEP